MQARHFRTGDNFSITKGPVTTVQLVMYAGASGDFNRIHYDLPFAKEAGLGGVIAHGMLTMGFAAQLLTDWGGPRSYVKRIAANFKSPVEPGDSVVVKGAVSEVQDLPEGQLVSVSYTGLVGEREVISGHGAVLFPQPSA